VAITLVAMGSLCQTLVFGLVNPVSSVRPLVGAASALHQPIWGLGLAEWDLGRFLFPLRKTIPVAASPSDLPRGPLAVITEERLAGTLLATDGFAVKFRQEAGKKTFVLLVREAIAERIRATDADPRHGGRTTSSLP
jgi:hypothetical protein